LYFKRPSFRRGGSTGIAPLTPRKNFQFGTPGFNFLESGLQNELRAQNELRNRPRIGTRTVSGGRQNIPTGGLTKGTRGARLLTQLRNLSIPSASTTGLMSLPFVLPAGLAYMNRPKTLAEKKVMQDYGMLDETFGVAEDYEKYDADRKAASQIGDEISFTDAIFMDPETGKYPKILGRTEDREIETKLDDDFEMPRGGGADFAEIAETVIADKKEDTPIKTDDDAPKEKTFDSIYEEEKKKIEKLIGEDDNKGMLAIALSEAIGTPGTIADKAAVLNKSLLGIMQGKKKDRKDIAKLAYTATKEIEKAKIAAGKEVFSEKELKNLKRLQRIVNDTTGAYSDADKTAAQAEINITKQAMNVIGGKKGTEGSLTGLNVAATQIEKLNKLVKKIQSAEPGSKKYNENLQQYIAIRELLIGSNNRGVNNAVARLDNSLGLLTKKDGGRIKKQLGGSAMEVSETVGQGETPTAQVQQLSFSELRNRLPKEITDDVIRLLSNSNEALQDFAYIRTQGDVSKFNTKYGVTLVLPAQTA